MADDTKYVPWDPPAHLAAIIRSILDNLPQHIVIAECRTLPGPVKMISGTITADNPVGPSPARVGTTSVGVNDTRKVECPKSKFHGFRPANEPCPMCDPEVSGPAEWTWRNGQLVFQ